ncbi:MAG TPA: hypothetical protein VFX17_01220 [Patescibacteria group bacterium]|nr:hypothetical protein [Patescibacteria group bacterium]
MARPTNTKRKLTKTGSGKTLVIAMPAEFVRMFGWHEHQYLQLKRVAGGILIHDAKTKKR